MNHSHFYNNKSYFRCIYNNVLNGFQGYDSSGGIHYYQLLEVPQDASTEDIKQSYRSLVLKYHPDRGGDPEKFKEIKEAYEILVNPEKRKIYDKYGEDGVNIVESEYPNDFDDDFDLYNESNHVKENKPIRTEDISQVLPVTLEELYNGTEKSFTISRIRKCKACNGHGTKNPGNIRRCSKCNGTGKIKKGKFVNKNVVEEVDSICTECNGEGRIIKKQDKCKECNGKKYMRVKEVMKVTIKPGNKDGDKIILKGCSDEKPNTIPGDLIFELKERDHPIFKRQGDDLLIVKKIPLADALTGVNFEIPFLNNKNKFIQSKPDDILSFGTVRKVENLGMPDGLGGYGKLYIKFNIEMPKILTNEQKRELNDILNKQPIKPKEKDINYLDKP